MLDQTVKAKWYKMHLARSSSKKKISIVVLNIADVYVCTLLGWYSLFKRELCYIKSK